MSLLRVQAMLKQLIGLDPESIGRAGVERAMLERQRQCGIDDADRYWEHLVGSAVEQQQLIDTVIVPETWFFRDREAFRALGQLACEALRRNPSASLRLLSVPCASGEEPYSMAMALLDAGLAPERFAIDAIDVSAQQLERARVGSYGRGSFRGDDLGFRTRHFETDANRFRIGAEVRKQVRFHHRNLFAADLALPSRCYDVIWCRNLLIYFDRATQDLAVGILGDLLASDGLLFVGSSESGAMSPDRYEPVRLPMAFAFRKHANPTPRTSASAAPAARQAPARLERPRRRLPATAPAASSPRPPAAPLALVPPSVPIDSADADRELHTARALADAGRFADAAARCEAHMRKYGPSADALYLEALVRDARGEDAEQTYRKVLYLDPHHSEALMHLWLLLDRKGRPADAHLVRERLRRLEGRRT